MQLLDARGVVIDVDKLVAIKNGSWSNERQDWLAIAIFVGNTEIELGVYVRQFQAMLEGKQL